ncbi:MULTISPECIES: trypsin-like peptidase domain-containing protein [unclassified Azospirillum]|uniref:nSTAND1 domain-containing NTPase n=1 Tax=unclassified Azospirillum TaxID=2630922 RepID=UPI000B71F91C|nr:MULTISPECIES: trypsin-like peptidase domain-containing protein [unclassified Azospirillum]SNT09810.1 WD40 repeat [Azospirillum sp. RU38E]SNT25326.1 WD40 repeat [Azospirillum sp. RU37A]
MSQSVQDCIIRIWTEFGEYDRASKAVVGTGFLVKGADGQAYAITCAHVVNAALGLDQQQADHPENATIRADMPGRGVIILTLLAWFPPTDISAAQDHDGVADIAILRPVAEGLNLPESLPPLRVEPPRQVVPLNANVPFHTFGYMVSQNGLAADGQLKATDHRHWFVAYGHDGVQPFIEEGLSGAPAFSRDGRQILGMVVQRLARELRQGFVIPGHALAKAWPLLTTPYPGLSAFDQRNAHLFFGRGRAPKIGSDPSGKIKEILDRLAKQRLMAIVGTSGSGKSSLVKAGIAEDYRRRGWALFTFRPTDTESQDIAGQIKQRLVEMGQGEDASSGTLFIIDQFEEFFPGQEIRGNIGTGQPDRAQHLTAQRTKVLSLLLSAVTRPDVHCLLTARLDLLETMVTADETVARLFTDPYPSFMLTAMSVPEVREAIEGPARLFGVETDSYFAGTLAVEATRGAGRLPLLQEALRQCWRRLERVGTQWRLRQPPDLADGDPARLLEDALRRALDIDRALLSLVRLVDDRPLRRRLPLSELTSERDRRLLEDLARERIAVVEGEGSARTVELLHESLMSGWQKLADLIAQHRHFLSWRDRFDREFAAWQQGGREGRDLLRRHDLEQAREWQAIKAGIYIPPTPDQEAFIQASWEQVEQEDQRIAAELWEKEEQNRRLLEQQQMLADQNNILVVQQQKVEEQNNVLTEQQQKLEEQNLTLTEQQESLKKQNSRTKRWLGIAMVLLALAIAASITGYWLFQEAQRQESRVLAAFSRQENDRGDHMSAMLLALEALPNPGLSLLNRPVTAEAEAALRQAWMQNREIKTLVGHEGAVIEAAFSPDGKRVSTASVDGTVRVWDLSRHTSTATILKGHAEWVTVSRFGAGDRLETANFSPDGGKVITSTADGATQVWDLSAPTPTATILQEHFDRVIAASFSTDGKRVVTASGDNTARVWDLSAPTPTATILKGHTGWVNAASFSPDGKQVVTASNDSTARVWDLSEQYPTATILQWGISPVTTASFSPDGRQVVTTSSGNTAQLWDMSSPEPTLTILEGHTGGISAASFNTDGKRVLTASLDNTVRVWDLSSQNPTATILQGHTGPVNAASFSSDGKRVLTASSDNTARVWDLSAQTPTATILQGHTGRVIAATFSSDGKQVITASADNTARVWDLSAQNPTATTLQEHTDIVYAASFSPDSKRVVTASADNTARVWDLSGPAPTLSILQGHTGGVNAARFSPDGERVLTASADDTARVWDLSGPTPTATILKGHTGTVRAASFSTDGNRVVTTSDDNTARVWDLSEPTPTSTILEMDFDTVCDASFSADGNRVITANIYNTAQVWDLSAQTLTATILKGHTGEVTAASFSPDSKRAITASEDNTARVWDLSAQTPTATILQGHTGGVNAASFSPDGNRVVTASSDKTARVWDLSAQTPTKTILQGHTYFVNAASFSPDGKRVVTASFDQTARVWDLSAQTPTATILKGHTDWVRAASFSPDGKQVVTASNDGTVLIHPYPDIDTLIRDARKQLTRCLTRAQWQQFGVATTQGDRDAIPMPDAQGQCPRNPR